MAVVVLVFVVLVMVVVVVLFLSVRCSCMAYEARFCQIIAPRGGSKVISPTYDAHERT